MSIKSKSQQKEKMPVLTFFVYFKQANLSFTERTISNEILPNELIKWGNMHWARIFCEAVAFVCGLILLLRTR